MVPWSHLGWDPTRRCVSPTEWGAWKGKGETRAGRDGANLAAEHNGLWNPNLTWQGQELRKPLLPLPQHLSDCATPRGSLRSRFKSLWAFKEDKKSGALWGKKAKGMFHCSLPFMIRYSSIAHWIHLKDCYWVHCFGSRLQIKYFKDFINFSTGYKALRRKPRKRYKKEKEMQRDRNSCTPLKQDVTTRCSL